MKILVLGAGRMGKFLTDVLCVDHEVALFDLEPKNLRFVFNTYRMTSYIDVREFAPELVINCVTLKYTIDAFESVIPYLSKDCIIADIASVKTGLPEFYAKCRRPYVSTHPMFGPTFASLDDLSQQSAVVIAESDPKGKAFFLDLYRSLHLNVFEYTFVEHDATIAYSLSIPFASSMVFASVMKYQEAPGTTFKKHMTIAKGLFSEDDYLISEILFNPFTKGQLENIRLQLRSLIDIIDKKDTDKMHDFIKRLRDNIK